MTERLIFSALSNRTRIDILRALQDGEMTVSALVKRLKLKQAFVSQSLKRLSAAGLVVSRREGRYHHFSCDQGLAAAILRTVDLYVGRQRSEDQKELRESERLLTRLFDAMPDGVLMLPVGSRRFSYANRAAAKMFGAKDVRQLLASDIMRIIPPSNQAGAEKRIAAFAAGQLIPAMRVRRRRLDGTPIDLESSAAPVVWQKKRVIFSVIRDMAPRLAAQERLERSEARFRTVLEALPDFVLIIGRDHRIKFVNRDMTKALPESVSAVDMTTFVHDGDKSTLRKAVDAVLRTGRPQEHLMRAMGEDNALRRYAARFLPLDKEKGKYVTVLVITKDLGPA